MINVIKKLFSQPKNEIVESLNERGHRIGNKFARLLIDKFEFDIVNIVVDNPKELNLKSFIYTSLVASERVAKVSSDLDVQQLFSDYTGKFCKKKHFVTFQIQRKYNDNTKEIRYLFGYVNDNEEMLYFLDEYSVDLFTHHEITPYIKNYGQFKVSSFYYYNAENNQLTNAVFIPLSYTENKLDFHKPDNLNFFPNYKTYLITIKTNINNQRFSKDAIISISFGDNILKSHTCEIEDTKSFEYNLLKILFPFNLEDAKLNRLQLTRESLDNISQCYNEQFKNYELVKNMVKI